MKKMSVDVLIKIMSKSGILFQVENGDLHIWNERKGSLDDHWQKLCLVHKDELCDHFNVKRF